jgi:hypothetical protein
MSRSPKQAIAPGFLGVSPILFIPSIIVTILVSISVIAATTNNQFWADDFGNIAAFNSNLGEWNDFSVNAARPVLNVFFYLMGISFGTGSAFPYLISASLIVLSGLLMSLYAACALGIISKRMSIFVFSILMSSTTLFPIFLWSTNITHGASIFCFGVFSLLYSKNSTRGKSYGISTLWEALWISLIVLCNPLYLGVIIIFASLALTSRFQGLRKESRNVVAVYFTYFCVSILLPIVYFFFVSQPEQKKNLSYANTGISNILPNLEYYSSGLISSELTLGLLVLISTALLFRARINLLDLGLLGASGTVLLPVLIQSNQRVLNYLVVPILLLCIVFVRVLEADFRQNFYTRSLVGFIIIVLPVVIFTSTKETRSWYVYPGLGSDTKSLITQLQERVPQGGKICVSFRTSKSEENFLIGGFSAGSAFSISPIYSGDTLMDAYANCKDDPSRYQVTIEKNKVGKFVITEPKS